ncbi:bestrophin-1 [Trichonephila inaurata madagascariensis]|uniref:Bestrophin homolog n=1 Tax=Trichonephila inaurata madagascariensis TaxID=2747483 RepID=A0A8X6YQG5_9ARAC|nr:bestrophin-1 [Trichonephila inaurata madagascariensis]
MYRFFLSDFQKKIFERIVFLCSTFMDLIPLSFVLGFYVSFIATRWWNQYTAIPWPDKLMNSISLYVSGTEEIDRVLRHSDEVFELGLNSSPKIHQYGRQEKISDERTRFMTKLELEMLNSVPSTEFNTFWIPCTWFINLLREAKQECRITDSNGLKLIMEVVTLATYAFFGACIFGRQYVDAPDKPDHNFELYIPIFTIFQLFFYMGLLKVSYLGVDVLNSNPPPLVRDNYYYQLDMKLPYTEAALGYKKKTYRGSVAKMQIPQEKQNLLVPEFSEDDDEDKIAATYGMGNRGASLWTLVGGKLNTRFSVSNQNLDTVTLESGSNNWKVSNPSLFISDNEIISDNKNTTGSAFGVQMPDETSVDMNTPSGAQRQTSRGLQRKASDTTKTALKKAVKKVVPIKRPHLRRKGHNHPQNRWIAFHATPGRDEDHEVLSLYKGEKPVLDQLTAATDHRRQSFDERSMAALRDKISSRFQSLPDVKRLAFEKGGVSEEWDDLPPEDQDNLSTANLLVLHESGDDSPMPDFGQPTFTFTRASVSPCPSSTDSGQFLDTKGNLGLQQASSLTSIHELHDMDSEGKSSDKK